jgi:hypothetical protein
MALSDELLGKANRLAKVRDRIERLVSSMDAEAGFLVDEDGNPFASVGHIEFPFPHPLAGLLDRGAASLLGALLGEPATDESRFVVERAGERALVVLIVATPLSSSNRALVHEEARRIAALLDRGAAEP